MIMNIRNNIRLLVFICIILVAITILYLLSTNMKYLPQGYLIDSVVSPNKKYSLEVYLIDGGQLSGDAIRVELLIKDNNKKHNVYWCYPQSEANIKWINNKIVRINDVEIDVLKDEYDCSTNKD